ncbi:MAG: alpha/beta hydrolase [Candidatus Woesebacteria bacterium]
MAIIQVAGLATNYETVGAGPALVLLHGWANAWEAWLPIIPFLSDHYTLLIPDLPGCGRTDTPKEGWSTPQHAKWLQDFLQATGQTVVGAVGHSYGGKILLEYCSGPYSHQPKKLALIDSSGIPNILNSKQKTLRLAARFTPKTIKDKITSTFRGKLYASFGADSDYVWANEFQKKTLQLILKEDYTQKLSSIAQPTLLLWGKSDTSTPLWQGETMHNLIPLNQLKTYDAGHFPHHTYPKPVSDELCHFL